MGSSPEPSFSRTAPAALTQRSTPRTDPAYCAMLLLEQFDAPAAVLHSELLVGLAVRCACQIALDYRRLEGMTTGGMESSMVYTSRRGSPRDLLHMPRRQSDTSLHLANFDAVRGMVDSSMLQEMERRMVYIIDSHGEDSGVPDGQSPSLVCIPKIQGHAVQVGSAKFHEPIHPVCVRTAY